jgi:hypothetical protein
VTLKSDKNGTIWQGVLLYIAGVVINYDKSDINILR